MEISPRSTATFGLVAQSRLCLAQDFPQGCPPATIEEADNLSPFTRALQERPGDKPDDDWISARSHESRRLKIGAVAQDEGSHTPYAIGEGQLKQKSG